MRLEHANITVSNIEQSYNFYHALFGFERRWEGMDTGDIHLEADYKPGKRIYFMDPNDVEIELVEY